MREKAKPSGAQAAKRGIWFFMRTVLMVTAFVLLCYGVFMTAMNTTNLYIIATEGMQKRAECILQNGDKGELGLYFTDTFLSRDAALSNSVYADYTVNSFDYRVHVEGIRAWPWASTASITITERMVNINATIHEDKKEEGAPEGTVYTPPEWESGRYRLQFNKHNGRWYIYQMVLLEALPSEAPLRTPDMRMTPRPAYTTPPPTVTPTPRPTNTPAASIVPEETAENANE